jgi:hypothetical protein
MRCLIRNFDFCNLLDVLFRARSCNNIFSVIINDKIIDRLCSINLYSLFRSRLKKRKTTMSLSGNLSRSYLHTKTKTF